MKKMFNFSQNILRYLCFFVGSAAINLSYLSYAYVMPAIAIEGGKQKSNNERIMEVGGFKFELLGCQRVKQKETAICNLMITNNSRQDSAVYLYRDGRAGNAFDTAGNEYVITYAFAGRHTGNNFYAEADLIRGVPVKGGVGLEIPEQVNQLAVLQIKFGLGGTNSNQVQFRNVAILGSSQVDKPNNPGCNCTCSPQKKTRR